MSRILYHLMSPMVLGLRFGAARGCNLRCWGWRSPSSPSAGAAGLVELEEPQQHQRWLPRACPLAVINQANPVVICSLLRVTLSIHDSALVKCKLGLLAAYRLRLRLLCRHKLCTSQRVTACYRVVLPRDNVALLLQQLQLLVCCECSASLASQNSLKVTIKSHPPFLKIVTQ